MCFLDLKTKQSLTLTFMILLIFSTESESKNPEEIKEICKKYNSYSRDSDPNLWEVNFFAKIKNYIDAELGIS